MYIYCSSLWRRFKPIHTIVILRFQFLQFQLIWWISTFAISSFSNWFALNSLCMEKLHFPNSILLSIFHTKPASWISFKSVQLPTEKTKTNGLNCGWQFELNNGWINPSQTWSVTRLFQPNGLILGLPVLCWSWSSTEQKWKELIIQLTSSESVSAWNDPLGT